MPSEIDRIARLLEKTFEKQPWYGPSILDTISDINPDQTSHKHGSTHSIIELILHMTSWRIFATRRLHGDLTFEVTDQLNFPKPGNWTRAVSDLKVSQQELLAAIRNFPEDRLGELVPSKTQKYTYYTLLHGVIQHDIYHLGQIAYIRKSLE